MTQIIKKERGIQSLSDKIKTELVKIKAQQVVFLLDVSGSMCEIVDGLPKIAHLRKVMQGYPHSRKVSFSGRVWEKLIPEPQSNTDMALGFRYLQRIAPKPASVVLVSDGLPDDPKSAISEAIKIHVPVNIVYIGEKGDKGEAFMQSLATATGGKTFTAETHKPQFAKQLSQAVAGYLPAGLEWNP
jgi:hypothetical protein